MSTRTDSPLTPAMIGPYPTMQHRLTNVRVFPHHVVRHRSPVVAISRLNNHSRARRGTCLLSLYSADKVCYCIAYFVCLSSDGSGLTAYDGDSFGPRHMDQFEGGRRSYYEDGVSHGGAASQGPIPTHAPAPIAPRHMWSQVLDPGHNPGAVPETNNPRGTFIQLDPPEQSMTKAFTPHGLLSAGLQDKEDRSAKKQEELARETGASLINVPNKPPPPQTGLLGAITAHERDRKREGGVGAALTEREREKRLAEERQRKLDELQRQQLEQMQQGGSLYGQHLAGFNPMMNPMNSMMMGMNPMAPSFMGYPGMMPNFGNPQHMFAAQQAAQAYQQAMFSLSQAGSQIGGEGGTPTPMSLTMTGAGMAPSPGPINPMMAGGMGGASPPPLNPMMTGGGMGGGMGGASPPPLAPMMTGGGMGAFDPRFSMMSMSMMNPMAMGMGMGNPGMMGAPMGMGMPMNNGAGFDPRMSQFDPGHQVPNSNFIQSGRPGSTLGLEPSPGAGDAARRSPNASPRPPQ
jgi:CCR4-NOT transcriptional complex subunit CAF120